MKAWRLPKLIDSLRTYSRPAFLADLLAGITVGLVALPLAMAFAISSGVAPQLGLYCAVVGGFLISALGGSRTQIGGPTGAFVVVVFGIVNEYGVNGLFLCTIMAGVMLIALGASGLGASVRFIPRPVIIGFTNGIAILIASTQIRDFFGLDIDKLPGAFLDRAQVLAVNFHTFSITATLVSIVSLAVVLLCRKYVRQVPGAILAMLCCTPVVAVLGLPVETIGSQFGGIPSGLPRFALPEFDLSEIGPLLGPAFTLAMLGAIESLLSAVVADRMSGDKHDPNVELVAQGIANVASPLFGGLPATGAIARTATNIRSGAKTPVAGMIHALVVLAILLFAAQLVHYIPLSVLAAILLVVAYNMGEWREIPKLLQMSKAEISVWLVTLLLTVFADLTFAVQVGMVLAGLLFIRKVSMTTTVDKVTGEYVEGGRLHSLQDKHIPDYVTIVRIHGPFLFGTTSKLTDLFDHAESFAPIIILRLRNMTAIDATGLLTLRELAERLHKSGRHLIVCGARDQPALRIQQAHLADHIGQENICPHIGAALERAQAIHQEQQLLTVEISASE